MPDASLNIVISAVDKSSAKMDEVRQMFAGAKQDLDKLKASVDKTTAAEKKHADQTKGLTKAWGDFRNQVPGLDKALTLLTNPITLIGAGLAATGKIMKDSVQETIAYADQVRDLSRALGTTSEESSKLIQVADDLFVSYDTMKIAMKKAQVEGINPNIEGLMQLAKEYQNIQDPAERSAFAIKMFGKAGMEMTKILEKTPAELQKMADALEGSNLILSKDSVDAAYKYKQAMDELGDTWQGLKYQIGSALIPALTEATKGFTTHAAATIGLLNAAKSGKITWGEYIAQSAKVTWTSYEAADAQVWLNGKLVEARDAQNKYNESNMDARDRIAELTVALDGNAASLETVKYGIQGVTEAALGKEILDALTQAFREGTISENEYAFQARNVMISMLDMSVQEALTSISLSNLKQQFNTGAISSMEYVAAVRALNSSLSDLDGKKVTTTIHTLYTSEGEPVARRRQHGGPVTVGQAYIVGERRAELFVPNQNGRIIPSVTNNTNTNNSRMTLNVHTNAQSSTFLRDYRMLQARAG